MIQCSWSMCVCVCGANQNVPSDKQYAPTRTQPYKQGHKHTEVCNEHKHASSPKKATISGKWYSHKHAERIWRDGAQWIWNGCGRVRGGWDGRRNDSSQQNIFRISWEYSLRQIERHCANITTILTVTIFVRCIQLTTPLPFDDANTIDEEITADRTGQRNWERIEWNRGKRERGRGGGLEA